MNTTLEEAIHMVERVTRSVRDLRAERWLREWPEGHPERPKEPPAFVQEYLQEIEALAVK